jgi:signal peptidase I
MKRLLALLFILLICVLGYLSIWGYLPVSPVIGSGMEPEIKSGTMLTMEALNIVGVKPGDIVVYYVPPPLREKNDFPPVVARRVVDVIRGPSGIQLLIKGDSVDVNPFMVNVSDIKGVVRYRIPYLGLPLVFLQSRTGTILVPIVIIILALLLYLNDIIAGFRRRYRESLTPVIEDSYRSSLILSNRFEGVEKAVESFASSIQQYAQHMDSHISAIKGLSEASQVLKNSAVDQNQTLDRLSRILGKGQPMIVLSRVEQVVNDLEKRTQLVLQVRDELEEKKPEIELPPPAEIPPKAAIKSPPGCLANSKALYKKEHDLTQSGSYDKMLRW